MSGVAESLLEQGCKQLSLELSSLQLSALERYLDLLEKWNRVYNLSAIRDRSKMVSQHLLDSLCVIPHLQATRLLDVGSGAGLPGIPIAIAESSLKVTLLDSNHKKVAFLRQAVGELGLSNVTVSAERVESWQPEERFDTIISRAFSELGEFAASTKHLLVLGGSIIAMKGLHPYEELERLPPDVRLSSVKKLEVPGLDAQRHLVIMTLA